MKHAAIYLILLFPGTLEAGDALTDAYSAGVARIPYVGRDSRHFLAPPATKGLGGEKPACETARERVQARSAQLQNELNETKEPKARIGVLRDFAALMAGDEKSFADAEKHLTTALALAEAYDPGRKPELLALRGILRLRIGEQKNCVDAHNAESCIFPLSKLAVHRQKEWAESAARDFSGYLELDPGDLHVRWLLNLSLMAAGRYPAGVPKKFLIPLSKLPKAAGFRKFHDVGGAAGIQRRALGGGGALLEDLDGDGLLDVILSPRVPCEGIAAYRNNGDGTFSEPSSEGLSNELWATNVAQADFNNDGKVDLYVSRGGWFGNGNPDMKTGNSLLVNHGGWKFTNETEPLGLSKGKTFNVSAQWVDFDLDGWADLFVCNENRGPDLFRNENGKRFVESAAELGLSNAGVCKGSAWADINGDGWPDLVMANYGAENRIFLNEEGKHFREVKVPAINHQPTLGFSAFFFDYDNDGRPDLFIGAYNRDIVPFLENLLHLPPTSKPFDTHHVFHNVSTATEIRFEDVTKQLRLDVPALSMGSNFGDLDNDGYLDIFTGTGSISFGDLVPNQVFWNRGGKRFDEVSYDGGFANLQKGHGVAFGDVNNDGQEDILANIGGTFAGDKYFPSLYANPGFGNDWVTFELEGTESNRSAIGAKIEVRVRNGKKTRSLFRTVGATSSFGNNPLRAHFGLGKGARIEQVRIEWPNRKHMVSVYKDVAKNAFLAIREGDVEPRVLKRPAFRFPEGPGKHEHEGLELGR